MGKFDGVLLISDFDDTLVRTSGALVSGGELGEIPAYNTQRIRYFMAEGGRFAVVTGRVWMSFVRFLPRIPTNAPVGTGNGAAIVDPETGENLFLRPLPESVGALMEALEARRPAYACEFFRADNRSDVLRPNRFTRNHARMSGYDFREVSSFQETVPPLLKLLFEGEHGELEALRRTVMEGPWSGACEAFFSAENLLELIARGADKGAMAERLAQLCGTDLAHTYAIGDNANDLPMLRRARMGFAPANAIPAVLESGAAVLCDCMEGAVGRAIDVLDRLY